MIDKTVASADAAVADVADGATVMIGGFGTAGIPFRLVDALIAQGARELCIVNNNAGNGDTGLAALIGARRVRKRVISRTGTRASPTQFLPSAVRWTSRSVRSRCS